jgi:hypothetical protein
LDEAQEVNVVAIARARARIMIIFLILEVFSVKSRLPGNEDLEPGNFRGRDRD